MTKLCPRGKAAAKRKFAVYPSAYANAYASKICAGKIKDPSGKKRKDFRGPKPKAAGGGTIKLNGGGPTKSLCGAVTTERNNYYYIMPKNNYYTQRNGTELLVGKGSR